SRAPHRSCQAKTVAASHAISRPTSPVKKLKKKKRSEKTPKPSRRSRRVRSRVVTAAPVTAGELRALKREIERRLKPSPPRWNPDPEDVQRSVAQLVLTIV